MDIKELKTKSDRVYPEIVINAPNPAEAAVLQSDYAGKGSETTAIMTYIYQNYITRLYNEDVAEVLERIAITEMHHHDILGTTIARLGGNPVIGADNCWWTGANVNYAVNLKEMLLDNIKSGASRNSELSPHDSQAYKPIDNRNSRVHNSGRRGAHSDVRRAVEVS